MFPAHSTTTTTPAQVQAFFAIAAHNPALLALLGEINTSSGFYSTVAELALTQGYSFRSADVEQYFKEKFEAEANLSYREDDLEFVAGSTVITGCSGGGALSTVVCSPTTSQCWGSLC